MGKRTQATRRGWLALLVEISDAAEARYSAAARAAPWREPGVFGTSHPRREPRAPWREPGALGGGTHAVSRISLGKIETGYCLATIFVSPWVHFRSIPQDSLGALNYI